MSAACNKKPKFQNSCTLKLHQLALKKQNHPNYSTITTIHIPILYLFHTTKKKKGYAESLKKIFY